jgi:hypothetical protein
MENTNYYKTNGLIDYHADPTHKEHLEEIVSLLDLFYSKYTDNKIKFDGDVVVRLEKMTECINDYIQYN